MYYCWYFGGITLEDKELRSASVNSNYVISSKTYVQTYSVKMTF